MDLTLQNGAALRGDLVLSTVLRSDMAPIPLTLEATVRVDPDLETQLQEGMTLTGGRDGSILRIIKLLSDKQVAGAQGDRPYGPAKLIAALDPFHSLAFIRETAVIKDSATLGEIYRACGAKVKIASDFSVRRFACFVGDFPTIGINRAAQEEGGVLVWDAGSSALRFVRLPDLMKQKPVVRIAGDATTELTSGFLERHEVPAFYSVDPGGSITHGNRTKSRVARFAPRADARVLQNLTRTLVQRRVWRTGYAPELSAGACVLVDDTPHVIVTAAHVMQSGSDGSGVNAYTKVWLATLENA